MGWGWTRILFHPLAGLVGEILHVYTQGRYSWNVPTNVRIDVRDSVRYNVRMIINATEARKKLYQLFGDVDTHILYEGELYKIIKVGGTEKIVEPTIEKVYTKPVEKKEVSIPGLTKGADFVPRPPDPETGYPCCLGKRPCKHWQWDGNESAYINSLTGKKREAEY